MVPALGALVAAIGGLGCSEETAAESPAMVRVRGAVQKGPFVLGSTVTAAPLDGAGEPTGELFATQTEDDLGRFSVTLPTGAAVSIEAVGFYFNEVTGGLSGAPLTLRAVTRLSGTGGQDVFLNLVTHLSHRRIRQLLGEGAALDAVVAQAETELRTALGIGPVGFVPGAPGVGMDVLGGDTDANAYALAVSAVVVQAALRRPGPADANLQELVNTLAVDLADDGAIASDLTDELRAAEQVLDTGAVMSALAARAAALGSAGSVPDIDRVIDRDLDGVANRHDNCPDDPNPDQADLDADGTGDACGCGNGRVDGDEACDDGNGDDLDRCTRACEVTFCGDGVVNGDELCDDGNDDDTDGCLTTCLPARCGDGSVRKDVEECDDGNEVDTDVCLTTCVTARCGDGVVHEGVEVCDDGDPADDTCSDECTFVCGNGVVQGAEGCDDGNATDGDGCEADCTPPACANGIWDAWEVCPSIGAAAQAAGVVTALADGDVDADGRRDVVTAHRMEALLAVWRVGADGVPVLAATAEPADGPLDVAVGDLDGDGAAEIATVDGAAGEVRLWRWAGSSLASAGTLSAGGDGRAVAFAHLDGDDVLDLIVLAGTPQPAIVTRLGDGVAGFGAPKVRPLLGAGSAALDPFARIGLAAGDVDGDGSTDVAVAMGTFGGVYPGAGDGTLGVDRLLSLGAGPKGARLLMADVDADGATDVLMASADFGGVVLYRGGTGADAGSQGVLPVTEGCASVAVADIDRDGHLDLFAPCASGHPLQLGASNGSFAAAPGAIALPPGIGGHDALVLSSDLDGDCTPDLVFTTEGTATLAVMTFGAADGPSCDSPPRLVVRTLGLPAGTSRWRRRPAGARSTCAAGRWPMCSGASSATPRRLGPGSRSRLLRWARR